MSVQIVCIRSTFAAAVWLRRPANLLAQSAQCAFAEYVQLTLDWGLIEGLHGPRCFLQLGRSRSVASVTTSSKLGLSRLQGPSAS